MNWSKQERTSSKPGARQSRARGAKGAYTEVREPAPQGPMPHSAWIRTCAFLFRVGLLAWVLVLVNVSSAHAIEVQLRTEFGVSDGFDTVWGRVMRFGLRDSLATDEDLRKFPERVRLVSHDRDLGLIKLEIQQKGAYPFVLHLVDERPHAPKGRTSIVLRGSGSSRASLERFTKLVTDVARGVNTQ